MSIYLFILIPLISALMLIFSFASPVRPSDYNWINHYPTLADDSSNSIQFVDIGCGYGGLLGRQLRKLHVLLSDPLDFVENTFQMEQVKYVNFEDRIFIYFYLLLQTLID